MFGVSAFAAPDVAHAKKRKVSRTELEEAGVEDPRRRELPVRHRLRFTLAADWVRLSRACSNASNPDSCTRFHYAPLMLDFGYQVQFAKVLMLRPGIAFGGNVANSRNAMPAMIKPSIFGGLQHRMFGLAIGYTYTYPFPSVIDATNGYGGAGQPVIFHQHSVDGELSFTSRINKSALTFAVRVGGVNAELYHYDIDRTRWFFRLGFAFGVFWDIGKQRGRGSRRRKR